MNSKSFSETVAGAFVVIVGICAMFVLSWLYGIFAYGYVASKLWVWFIVTPLAMKEIVVPTFSILQCTGFMMIAYFFTQRPSYTPSDPDEKTETKVAKFLTPLLAPWATLFFGWLLHKIM